MLPFRFTRIGKWWSRQEEIDWIALNDKEKKALFVEVKWSNLGLKDVRRILRSLKEKSELVGLKGYEHHYMLIGKRAKKIEDELVIDLEDLEKLC